MRIVSLANSFRTGGRCLGGIELDKHNEPILQKNGRPKWIRPICSTRNEEVPEQLVSHISLLDIVEFTSIRHTGHGHQSENYLFEENSIRVIGQFPIASLDKIVDNGRFPSLFGNRGAAVIEDKVGELSYSLMLLSLTEFETDEKKFEDQYYPKVRLSFKYKQSAYNLPITDPFFLHKYGHNPEILDDKSKIYVTFSLAAAHKGWSYKLVAGVIHD